MISENKTRIQVYIDKDIAEQVKQVAERYEMSMSSATGFLLAVGLDREKDYRPVLKLVKKADDLIERIKDDGKAVTE